MRPPGLLEAAAGHVSHLAQLRKCREFGGAPHKDIAEARALLAKTEHFVFTAIPAFDDDMLASMEAMTEAGVWHLPFPVCTFEFQAEISVNGVVPHPGVGNHFIAVCSEPDDCPQVDFVFCRANPHCWIDCLKHDDRSGAEAEALKRGAWMTVDTKGGHAHPIAIVGACMVGLATRGIRRERYIGGRPVLLNRPEPRDAYTKVLIREAYDWQARGGHSASQDGTDRHAVRLHLRRGHIRHQPHGPRSLGQTRQIWIAPMLIGYAEEGTVEHSHYERRPRHWPRPSA